MFLQQLITGLSVGSIYALMAVGYSLIYSLLNFTNFAHGASVLIGAYVGYFYISSVADNVLMAVVCSTFFGAVLAALIERIAYQPLLNKGVKRIYLLIAGLGISIIGENLIVVMIDGRFHAYKTSLSAMPVSILGASIGVVDLIILVASAIALLSVQFLIRKTRVGLAIRGAAFDLTTASIMGINVRQLILIVFIIAGSMAGLSGVFLGIKYTAYYRYFNHREQSIWKGSDYHRLCISGLCLYRKVYSGHFSPQRLQHSAYSWIWIQSGRLLGQRVWLGSQFCAAVYHVWQLPVHIWRRRLSYGAFL